MPADDKLQGHIERRLVELREDLESGKARLAEIDQRRSDLIQSVLRVSGAVRVLEELMSDAGTHHLSSLLTAVTS